MPVLSAPFVARHAPLQAGQLLRAALLVMLSGVQKRETRLVKGLARVETLAVLSQHPEPCVRIPARLLRQGRTYAFAPHFPLPEIDANYLVRRSTKIERDSPSMKRTIMPLEEPPVPYATLRNLARMFYCAHCGDRRVRLRLCGGCRRVRFCSHRCQKREWPHHRAHCDVEVS